GRGPRTWREKQYIRSGGIRSEGGRRFEMTCLGKILILMVLAAASLTLVGCSSAHLKHATKDQAQTMATKAANAVKKDGDKTFTAFNNGGEWRDGDLYVFVIDKTGTWRASGAHPELVG